ncbi:MAG: hypothetical protein JNK64_22725 [Myxococcales bacterium]|nr:hypothetical protein [Myxococcales bacterium]
MKAVAVIALMTLCSCWQPAATQYALHVHPKDPARNELCYRQVSDESVPATVATSADPTKPAAGSATDRAPGTGATNAWSCGAAAAQPLHVPSTMTVYLHDVKSGDEYDLRVAEFSREASPEQVKALFAQVLTRAANLAKLSASGKAGSAFADILDTAATQVGERAPEIAAALADRLVPAADAPARPGNDVLFARHLKPGGGLLAASSFTTDLTPTREPSIGRPPPRLIEFTPSVLDYLRGKGADDAAIARHVVDWCDGTSFDNAPIASKKWSEAFAPANLDMAKLMARLDVTSTDIAAYLLGKKDKSLFQERTGALLDEVTKKGFSPSSLEARTFYAMVWAHNIRKDATRCQRNLQIATELVTDATLRAALEAARASLTKLTDAARPFDEGFAQFAPAFEAALTTVNTRTLLDGSFSFGVMTLHPGTIDLGVGTVAKGGSRSEVASYKFPIKGIERLAVFVGPVATGCLWGCMDRVVESTTPADATTPASRKLVGESTSYDFGLGTALHITANSWIDWGLGAVVGYPFSAPAGSSNNILTGLGLRHSSGLELVAGLHWFQIGVPKIPDGQSEFQPIDLGLPGNAALTVDDVSTQKVQVGAFLMLGFAPGVL